MDSRAKILLTVGQLDRVSYYQLLRVAPKVERAKLQRAFHAFALSYHPDQHRREEQGVQDASKRIFERGVEAYTVLRDPDLTRFYDEQLALGIVRLAPEDFQRLAIRVQQPSNRPLPSKSQRPPQPENVFVEAMKTPDGKLVAKRLEKFIQEQRYHDAYLQAGLLETLEPNNPAVGQRIDKIAAYLKRVAR